MKELDTENANGIADDDDLLMKEVIGEDSDLFFLDAYLRDILQKRERGLIFDGGGSRPKGRLLFFRCRPTPRHGLLRRRHSSPPPIFPLFSPQRRRTRLAGTQVRHVPSQPPERNLRKKRQRTAPSPIPTDVPAHRADCRSIHAIKTSTTYRCSRAVSSRPAGIACHLARQPRQQQAVAC